MRAIEYAFRQAAASLWRGRGASTFAVAAIGLAMLVLGTLLLLTSNVQRVLDRWTAAAEFSVYLRDDATSEQRGAIEAAIDRSGIAQAREYVSKAQALGRFRREFAELAPLTTSFGENPFPASVEVRIRPDAERTGRVASLVREMARLDGVADVRYDREWLARVASGLDAVRSVGFGVVVMMALAAALTVATVVRLGLHARRDELDIMELVGSPASFIRGPFIAEGLLQGGVGALLALSMLWMGYRVASAWWGTELTALLGGEPPSFLPARLAAVLVAGGMSVGAAGGYAAARTA